MKTNYCYLCGFSDLVLIQKINKKPIQETVFDISKKKYQRVIYKCKRCSVFINQHSFNLNNLYSKDYNSATYSNDIFKKFKKIMVLPFEKSDNKHRVKRIIDYLNNENKYKKEIEILDIGSGLCVFLGEIKKYDFNLHCVDPSHLSVKHALENVGVNSAFEGDFFDYPESEKFDLITFNKVLEHVKNPIEMLSKAKKLLRKKGTIYIELPDGETAAAKGGFIDREEFYIEHHTIFTKKANKYLIESAGLKLNSMRQIHEPSDKYTIFSFLVI